MGNLILLDGAVGTSIWEKTTDKEPVWTYNITRPEIVRELANEYVAAGAKIILANTFGVNRISVKQNGKYSVKEAITLAMQIAKDAVKGTDVKVALSSGPLTAMMEPYGDLSEEEVADIYHEVFEIGIREKPDLIMLQTFFDLAMMTVAAKEAKKFGIPVFCTMSFEEVGKTMFGNSVDDMIEELTEVGVDAIGLNCSLGPDKAIPIIKQFKEKTNLPLVFKPNAGKPILSTDGSTSNPYSKEDFVRELEPAFSLVDYIGGCCGTNAAYIKALGEKLALIRK
ncbi:MAG: homocysteine S-methyltransferase family protein [Butyrivibrio sp.]|nr:homocysteine S-methyltransferase family protein [Butyrivibrio sp.]